MSICYKAAILKGSFIFRAVSRYSLTILYIVVSLGLFSPFTACGEHYDFEGTDDLNWSDCDGICEGIGWYQDTSMGYNSNSSLRSGPIEYQGVSCICKNVTGPSRITFYWNSDTDFKEAGQLSFMVDDDVERVYNSYGWRFESYSIRCEGNHTLKWVFRKFRFLPQWKGGGWIDHVNVTHIYENAVSDSAAERPITEVHPGKSPGRDMSKNASIDVVVTAYPERGPSNTDINFTILVYNSGEYPLQKIMVKSILAPGLSYTDNSATRSPNMSTKHGDGSTIIIWNNISMEPLKTVEIGYNASIDGSLPGILKSNVEVNGTFVEGDLNVTDNDAVEVICEDQPKIEILSPANGSELHASLPIQFIINVTGGHQLLNCSLYIDDKCVNTSPQGLNDSQFVFEYIFGKDGVEKTHSWYIKCCDNSDQCSNTSNTYLYVAKPNKVYVDPERVDNFVYYASIDDAIKNINNNDTIIVESGTYKGPVLINKSLTLIGNNSPIIDNSSRSGSDAIYITESHVNVTGFRLEKSYRGQRHFGIKIISYGQPCRNITIFNNTICGEDITGGYNYSMMFNGVTDLNIVNNTIIGSQKIGIHLMKCNNCTIESNWIDNMDPEWNDENLVCIKLDECQNVSLKCNTLRASCYGIKHIKSTFDAEGQIYYNISENNRVVPKVGS
ncbi:MAG TPA: hypothetical protein PLM24_00745 [Methanothrix sp.]|nr:hypothetical protein [Methanothrix sp.]